MHGLQVKPTWGLAVEISVAARRAVPSRSDDSLSRPDHISGFALSSGSCQTPPGTRPTNLMCTEDY